MSMSIKDVTAEQVRDNAPALYEQIRKSVDPEKEIEKLTTKLTAAETANEELTEANAKSKSDLEEMTIERDGLKDKVDKFEATEKLSEKKDMVTKMISEAKMPKELISPHFTEQLIKMDTEDEIKATIQDRVAIYDKNKGKVIGSGEEHVTESADGEGELTDEQVLGAATR